MTTIQPYPVPRKPWVNIVIALLYFLLYEGIHFAVGLGASLYFAAISPDEATMEALFNEHSNMIMILLDLIVVLSLSIIVLARGKTYFHGMGVRKSRPETLPVAFIAGIGLSCLLGFVMNYVALFFPELMEDYNQTMDVTYNMGQIILYALAGVVGAPLVEELVFRHFMAGNFTKGMPRIAAIAVSSLLFGMVHQHIVQIVYAAILGVAMACIYFAYDSVLPSIALHAGFNAVSLLSMIDTSKWSETAQITFDMLMTLAFMALSFIGVAAMVLLLVRRTHPIWKNEKKAAAPVNEAYTFAPRPSAVEWDSLMAKPMESGKFPSVADLSASMKGESEDADEQPADEPKEEEV